MSDNSNDGLTVAESKNKAFSKPKKSLKRGFSDWFNDVKAELMKVIWPTRKDLIVKTITVIVTCLVFAVIIVIFDFAFGSGVDIITKLIK